MDAQPPAGFLDAVAGQPLLPAARDALVAALSSGWSDPAAIHHPGRQTRQLLEAARASVAASLTALGPDPVSPQQVHFTATIDAARRLALAGLPGPKVLSAVEPLGLLDAAGPQATLVGVDALGRVDADAFAAAIGPHGVGCLQAANPEVGTVQPVGTVAAGESRLLMDATQCLARLALPTGWSVLTAAGTDVAGPSGLALLVATDRWVAPDSGASGWLDGSPNVPAAVATAIALETLLPQWTAEAQRAFAAIAAIREAAAAVPDVEVVGDDRDRLPHVATFSALYVSGEALVAEFARRGFFVASGSACLQVDRPSHVLAAMGAYTGGNVRVSLPFGFADETVDRFVQALPQVIATTRGDLGRG